MNKREIKLEIKTADFFLERLIEVEIIEKETCFVDSITVPHICNGKIEYDDSFDLPVEALSVKNKLGVRQFDLEDDSYQMKFIHKDRDFMWCYRSWLEFYNTSNPSIMFNKQKKISCIFTIKLINSLFVLMKNTDGVFDLPNIVYNNEDTIGIDTSNYSNTMPSLSYIFSSITQSRHYRLPYFSLYSSDEIIDDTCPLEVSYFLSTIDKSIIKNLYNDIVPVSIEDIDKLTISNKCNLEYIKKALTNM